MIVPEYFVSTQRLADHFQKSGMAESLVPPQHCFEPIGCANCFVYEWEQPEDLSTLKSCGQCKVLQYCSKECHAEHWELVHKKHCKKLKQAKEAEQLQRGDVSSSSVGVFSQHPFPLSGKLDDTTEILVDLIQRILVKMWQTGHPAWDLDEVRQLIMRTQECRQLIWADRKLFPKIKQVAPRIPISAPDESMSFDPNNLWSTLLLVIGRLSSHSQLVDVNNLKEPQRSIPEKLWQVVKREVGIFPDRLQDLIRAFCDSEDHMPPFIDLLKILCGGSLLQKCSFCNKDVTVAAIAGEANGCREGVSILLLEPHLPVLFACSATTCHEQIESQGGNWTKWVVALFATHHKLISCDFCFKGAEEVHRLYRRT